VKSHHDSMLPQLPPPPASPVSSFPPPPLQRTISSRPFVVFRAMDVFQVWSSSLFSRAVVIFGPLFVDHETLSQLSLLDLLKLQPNLLPLFSTPFNLLSLDFLAYLIDPTSLLVWPFPPDQRFIDQTGGLTYFGFFLFLGWWVGPVRSGESCPPFRF